MIGKPGNQVVGNQRCRARGKWGLWASLSVQLPIEQCNSGTVQYCSSASAVQYISKQITGAHCTEAKALKISHWKHSALLSFIYVRQIGNMCIVKHFSHFSIGVIPTKFDAFSPSHFRRQSLTNLYLIPFFFFF